MQRLATFLVVLHASLALTDAPPAPPAARMPAPDSVAPEWRTPAEKTGYVESGTYDDTVAYCRRLDEASEHARYLSFGRSPQGRELPLLVLSSEGAFTPQAARASDKPLVLIQNGIHSGEIEGKDACLVLAREMVVTGALPHLLDRANVLIIPILNVDGHERRSPYSRINQVGPREMGWRTTATNLNLNRDYMKADAPETRAWLKLWNDWSPHLFLDCHTTDGEEHRYDLFHSFTLAPEVAAPVSDWVRAQLMPGVLPPMEKTGYHMLPYCWLRNRKNPAEGLTASGPVTPRFSTGYVAACNRPAVLIEAHARNPYVHRVRATYDFLLHALAAANAIGAELRHAIARADERSARFRGADEEGGEVPLKLDYTTAARPVLYRGYEIVLRKSEITGDEVIEYQLDKPRDYETNLYEVPAARTAIKPPFGYIIPPEWGEVIERLELHGIRVLRLREASAGEVEVCRFEEATFRPEPHEGRQMPSFKLSSRRETRTVAPGSALVPLDQPRARLAVYLLEPSAPDSFAAWGFFNAVFEQKEYAEAYVMEPLARRMLAEDAQLRAEFERRLSADPDFARNPSARLNFFYERSVYRDERRYVYPVLRVVGEAQWQGFVSAAAGPARSLRKNEGAAESTTIPRSD